MKLIQHTFSNGMRLLMVPQAEAPTATVLVLVGTGSKYEAVRDGGLSHFLEHMMFKGTVRHPSAKIISELFDGLGAVSNAFTDRELTGYYAKGNPKHVPTFIDVLGDIYLNTMFAEAEVVKERGVIIEEINMYDDMPAHRAAEQLYGLMYGDQPAGRSVLGTKETVSAFTAADFVRYKQTHYTAHNTLMVVAGSFDHKKVKAIVAGIAKQMPTGKSAKKTRVRTAQTRLATKIFKKTTDQTHIAIGFHAAPYGHKDAVATWLLSTILGGGMSSRLFITLREELGAAYYVKADYEPFTDHGIFSIHTGTDKKRVAEIITRVIDELVDIKDNGVPQKELSKAQEYLVGMMRLGLESSDSVAEYAGFQLLLKGDIMTPEMRTKQIMAVTAADVRRIARAIFKCVRANLSVVGPFTGADIDIAPFKRL